MYPKANITMFSNGDIFSGVPAGIWALTQSHLLRETFSEIDPPVCLRVHQLVSGCLSWKCRLLAILMSIWWTRWHVTQNILTSWCGATSRIIGLCEWNPPVTSGSPHKMPIIQSLDIIFVVSLDKMLSKQLTWDKTHVATLSWIKILMLQQCWGFAELQ